LKRNFLALHWEIPDISRIKPAKVSASLFISKISSLISIIIEILQVYFTFKR
jgi:hypothetical protein